MHENRKKNYAKFEVFLQKIKERVQGGSPANPFHGPLARF